jgi:two-component system OmpR family response regulator
MSKTILVVEDDATIMDVLRHNLLREGYEVVTARDGEAGLAEARSHRPDLIILDIMLPRLDGIEVCRILRKEMSVPILMLTARAGEIDRVVGLEMGADDYVTKPFSLRELLARVKALLRRGELVREELARAADSGQEILRVGNLVIDVERHVVLRDGMELGLSPKEFDLLAFLARSPRRAFSRDHLLEKVWGYDYGGDSRTVDVHIRWLRQKIEDDPAQPTLLLTVRGVGYKLEA